MHSLQALLVFELASIAFAHGYVKWLGVDNKL